MSFLLFLRFSSSSLAFRSLLSAREAYPSLHPTFAARCLQFCCKSFSTVNVDAYPSLHPTFAARCLQFCCKSFSTVNVDADSWGSGRRYIRGYENIPELESAPEEVKRIFSLQNANQFEHRKVATEKVREQYTDRAEKKIAELSVKIEAVKMNNNTGRNAKKDKSNKVFLNWLTSQRKKKLGHLKNAHFDRYLTLSKELDIPLLESPHTKWNKYKFRKFKIGVEVKEKKRFHR